MATMTASRRLDAPSFVRRFSMWFLAVYQLTPNPSAMYLVSQPNAGLDKTSRPRAVSRTSRRHSSTIVLWSTI